jgi:hypothetical protein
VIVEPFNNLYSLVDTSQKVIPKLQVIAHNKIHWMCPTEKDNQPWHAIRQQASHFPSIPAIICAICHDDNSIFRLDKLDIINYKTEQVFTALLLSRDIMCSHQVGLSFGQAEC